MRNIPFYQAVNEALHQEMERDGAIFIMGSDIVFGGRAGMTSGLAERFGRERVIDTPINEEIFVGMGIGAAEVGTRPIIELVHSTLPLIAGIDFLRMGVWEWVSGAKIPLVVRVRTGEEVGPELSTSLASFLSSLRGVQVAAPSTPYQIKGILASALRGDKPVVVLENSGLFVEKSDVPHPPYMYPFGKGEYIFSGNDVSIISYSVVTKTVRIAHEELVRKGIGVDVLDLVSLRPLDENKILQTARKTKKILILSDESLSVAGLPYKIYYLIKEKIPEAKIHMLGAKEIPVPLGPLREVILPETQEIVKGCMDLIKYK
jgi:pyruvate/2-oxoglutarate/acetoin dehydrogenase E1 component